MHAPLLDGGRRQALAVGLLLSAMAGLLVLSSLHKRLVYDEYDNLAYGYRVLTRGPVVPPNGQRMPILALNALGCPAPCRQAEVDPNEARRLLLRLPTMAFALGLGLVIYRWALEWFGPRPALLALLLSAFHPSFLAHGKQVTSDVAAAFFTVAALWAAWRLSRRRGPAGRDVLLLALATTGALLSKYTSALLFPLLVILLALDLVRRARDEGRLDRVHLRETAKGAVVFVFLVLLFLNAAYLFQGTLRRADSYPWRSARLQPLARLPLPLPLPRTFVLGIDFSYHVQEQPDVGRGNNYVLGRLNTEGVSYAFPLMILLKTPLGLLALLLVAWRSRPRGEAGAGAWTYLFLPFALFVAFFSLFVRPQLGIRYLLPALPFLILYAARSAGGATGTVRTALTFGLTGWAVVSALSYHPHYMSYFNELIGPRVGAYRFLADSNLDWEDRSYEIERFRARHPAITLVVEPELPQAGWILVGANKLVGVYEPERYRWLRENFRPIGHVGYSYFLFRVPPDRLRVLLSRPAPTAPGGGGATPPR